LEAATTHEGLPQEPERSILDRILGLLAPVRAGESVTALILAANVFLLLGAYYILKTVREPLILDQPNGALIASRATGFQAVLFLLVIPIYSAIASRFNRMKLIATVMLFFAANLAIFYAAGKAGMAVGVPFFLWVGIFNMLAVAQAWAFANDVYTEEEGKRLFPIVGVGASLGAWVGSTLVTRLSKQMDPFDLMLLVAMVLGICVALTYWVHARESHRAGHAKAAVEKLDKSGGIPTRVEEPLPAADRRIGAVVHMRQLSGRVPGPPLRCRAGRHHRPGGTQAIHLGVFRRLLQLGEPRWFPASDVRGLPAVQWIGVGGALFVLPLIAAGGYTFLAVLPVVGVIRVSKILENATDYSLNNTVRHALFLPTTRDQKYKGKAAVDTFFVRAGDLLQTGVVDIGTRFLALVGLGVCRPEPRSRRDLGGVGRGDLP
jgi:AAA family ATP:ADP antiporter